MNADSRLFLGRTLLVAALPLLVAGTARAVVPEGVTRLPDWDVRGIEALLLPAQPTAAQVAGLERLVGELSTVSGGRVVVHWGPQPGTLHHLFRERGDLSRPAPGRDPEVIARGFLYRHHELLGLTKDGVRRLELVRHLVSRGSGAAHLRFEQRLEDGVEIFLGEVGVHVAADGRIVSITGDTAPEAVISAGLVLTPADALVAASAHCGLALAEPLSPVDADERGRHRFADGSFDSPASVDATWFPLDHGVVRAWRAIVDPPGDGWYQVVVDASTGALLSRIDLVENIATEGLVFRSDPSRGPQVLLPFVDGDLRTDAASPLGWSDLDATLGNNCDVKDDIANDNETTIGERSVAAGPDPLSFSFPFQDDPTLDLDASRTNLFYVNNWLHDRLALMGFDEAAGNFQQVNFTGEGFGGDPVLVDAQDGGGTNNANFGTPPDGTPPRMQMYVWTRTTPNRDSGFDASVITHELFHGVSHRLVGGRENSGCLGGGHPGAMGEGWSDFFACSFWNVPVVGGYVTGNNARGIRRFPYDDHPHDYGDLCNNGNFQVHRDGEIWAATMWDIRDLFIARHGFQEGRCKAERLIMDGMKLAPCRPTYLDMRDAILLAARLHGVDGERCLLWEGFAGRGLGVDAVRDTDCTANEDPPVTSYDVPAECADCQVQAASDLAADTSEPNRVTVRFTPGAGAAEHLLLRSADSCEGPCLQAEFVEVARGDASATELVDVDAPDNRLSAGESWSYRVIAVAGECSAATDCVTAVVTGRCTRGPTAVDNLQAGVVGVRRPPRAACTVEVSWEEVASACGAPGDLRYNVYRSGDPGFTPGPEHFLASVPWPGLSYLDVAAPVGGATYVVRAEDLTAGGAGPHGGNEELNEVRRTVVPQGPVSGAGMYLDDAESGELPGHRRTGTFEPNDWAIVMDDNTRGGLAWHVTSQEGGPADKNLHLPLLSLGSAPRLTFAHVFDFEVDFDGGVIEISTDGGRTWTDLVDDIQVGDYNGNTRTVAGLMNPPNTDLLWTDENPSGFPTFDPVEVDLSPYADTFDVELRFRCLLDPRLADPGGWYVDDIVIEDVLEFSPCADSCLVPPEAILDDGEACSAVAEAVQVELDASASLPGASGFAADLPFVFVHDGPGSFDGARWAPGPTARLTFPAGTPDGDYPVTLIARGEDTCSDVATATVTLSTPPAALPLGPSLRVVRDGAELSLTWTSVGAPSHVLRMLSLGADLASLDLTPPTASAPGESLRLVLPPDTVFFKMYSAGDCETP